MESIFISGQVIYRDAEYIVLKNNNLGYKIFVLNNVLENDSIKTINLWIKTFYKEFNFISFGFLDYEEKIFFEEINKINGLGPKTAIKLMNSFNCIDLLDLIRDKKIEKIKEISPLFHKWSYSLSLHFNSSRLISKFKKTNKLPKKIIINDKEILVKDLFENLSALGYLKKNILVIFHKLKNKKYSSEEDFYKDFLFNLQNI